VDSAVVVHFFRDTDKHVNSLLIGHGALEVLNYFLGSFIYIVFNYVRYEFPDMKVEFLKSKRAIENPKSLLSLFQDKSPELEVLVNDFGDDGCDSLVEFVIINNELLGLLLLYRHLLHCLNHSSFQVIINEVHLLFVLLKL
jgi:hypothetical protein